MNDTLEIDNLRGAVASLERSLAVYARKQEFDADVAEVLRGGVIQCFEFTYEIAWKTMTHWLALNIPTAEPSSRRNTFRLCGEYGLISDVEFWFDSTQARNLTSHTYNEDTAESVVQTAVEFLPRVKALLANLEKQI
ncbi:nucleotidyltransferase [Campylobacterota bacterium]|nr:nucleotidyltransferase [Campylobacterota bacterium]